MKPHQVDAALFALKSPLSKGALLADEVGLGKTIEAGLVIAQRWAEQRRRILLIVPASLRKQWTQELQSKFSVASEILESKSYRERKKVGVSKPFEVDNKVVVTSYEFAARQADEIASIPWDLVVFDEAHRLRNVFKKNGSQRAKELRRAVQERFKVLLTATPLQNSLLELFGLVSVVDDKFFGDEASFKSRYGNGYQKWAYFHCPCGCKDTIMLSLSKTKRPHWTVQYDGLGRPTIEPSVRQIAGCFSHFWVRRGVVEWCRDTGRPPKDRFSEFV